MKRRESLKTFFLGGIAGGLALTGCNPPGSPEADTADEAVAEASRQYYGRTPAEEERDAELKSETFYDSHEMATITALANLIIPPNEFGDIKDASVPEFIEFISKDIPSYQLPIRGGLMWLNHESNTRNGKEFIDASEAEQKQILDDIAFYEPDSEEPTPMPIRFFSVMRNLTTCGYFTSAVGIKDLGYVGNAPNVWDGVPEEVLAKHGVAYDPEWIAKCVDQSKREDIAQWDDQGNLIT